MPREYRDPIVAIRIVEWIDAPARLVTNATGNQEVAPPAVRHHMQVQRHGVDDRWEDVPVAMIDARDPPQRVDLRAADPVNQASDVERPVKPPPNSATLRSQACGCAVAIASAAPGGTAKACSSSS